LLVVRKADLPGATESAEIARAGYSIDRPFALTVHRNCSAKTDAPQPGALLHRCDSMPGDSGSPILLLKKANDGTIESSNIVGIHVTTVQSFESGVGYTARGSSGASASVFEEAATSALRTQR